VEVTEDHLKIYVDATRPATLNDRAGVQTDFATLEAAVTAWRALPSAAKSERQSKSLAARSTALNRSSGFITGLSLEAPKMPRHDQEDVVKMAEQVIARIESVPASEDEVYVVFDGKRIAKRVGTAYAGTWVSLEPGFEVVGNGNELMVIQNTDPPIIH
jgi:hypothetical protein